MTGQEEDSWDRYICPDCDSERVVDDDNQGKMCLDCGTGQWEWREFNLGEE